MTTLTEMRKAKVESFLPKIMEAREGTFRPQAAIFRRPIGWLNAENDFIAFFHDLRDARGYVSLIEKMEHIWTLVEIHWNGDWPGVGTAIEFNGGMLVSRLGTHQFSTNYPQIGDA